MQTNYNILIIDDENEILDALESAFLMTDYEVHLSDNPLTALGMIKKKHFHVIICDIAMPQMSGLELLKKIKEYNAFIQVVMITGHITIQNALNAFRYGATDCFFKPFENPDDIINSVSECIQKIERINAFLKKIVYSDKLEKPNE